MQTIHETIKELHGSLCDYIEATYHIGDEFLIKQRKELLGKPGVIHQTPYIESTPRYKTGKSFNDMRGLPIAALEAFNAISYQQGDLPKLIYDPPFQHQFNAIDVSLIQRKNLIITTGTGSGKTEAFLLPILGKLAQEAKQSPDSFSNHSAVRALILYPMNALVNDQLGRLRLMFGDPRIVNLFTKWSGRPPRFARYTSRTPYAGIRTSKKDQTKLKSLNDFYCEVERNARNEKSEDHQNDLGLMKILQEQGKWPSKPNLTKWFGEKGSRWTDNKTGRFLRGVTLPDDSELITRHEVHETPPDLLVTNYSMLEYMLMRPIERNIFDSTQEFYRDNTHEKFLVVLDEAHLYRGASGAEVGLLLRRLRERLNISPDRFQVICSTASFSNLEYAPEFCAQLSGLRADSFIPITGDLDIHSHSDTGSEQDLNYLTSFELQQFYQSNSDDECLAIVQPFLDYRNVKYTNNLELGLYHALVDFHPMGLLINETMKQAIPIDQLGELIFPSASQEEAKKAVSVLLALGSRARLDPNKPSLLPCRIHNFFRGLAGLWVCMDPQCREVKGNSDEKFCGKMYSQPRDKCSCGARVHELYTCRNCGTAYVRTYTDNIDTPSYLWSEPGQIIRTSSGQTKPLLPLDLLIEKLETEDDTEPALYDLETGRLNPHSCGPRTRQVYISSNRFTNSEGENGNNQNQLEKRGQFIPCGVCKSIAGRSSVQDHQTKGDEPFQTLVARQIKIQPATSKNSNFAPLQGRKVLTFSDSRQVAARLAPKLQMYSIRDSLRSLIASGFRHLQQLPSISQELNLEDLYLATLLGSKTLNVRLRPELKPGETFSSMDKVEGIDKHGQTEENLLHLCYDFRSEKPPEDLLYNIIKAVQDRFLGFEALAIASIRENAKNNSQLKQLPNLPNLIESPEAKIALVRTWLRCWQYKNFWLNSMPYRWRTKEGGFFIGWHSSGNFKKINNILHDRETKKVFIKEWIPSLLRIFTEEIAKGSFCLKGKELSLLFNGDWNQCLTCKSVFRPIPGFDFCIDCLSTNVRLIDPNKDRVFKARKGYYRKPVIEALNTPPRSPIALIAAEHTAQLNAPQTEDVFSTAEENELRFQDIDLGERNKQNTAIDVLSSTTTMEVGIDIGALTGVALRNMPPGRANYQQRSGRAGRRGNSVATVMAYGSSDSHDEHYFSHPDEMIRGSVVDPQLSLDNQEIVRRHIRAFLLQKYHQNRLPRVDMNHSNDLFSVLGTVSEFKNNNSVLNRNDFKNWLNENLKYLEARISNWIPTELDSHNRNELLNGFIDDCVCAIDEALQITEDEIPNIGIYDSYDLPEATPQIGETSLNNGNKPEKLLDRLLYCGKLPRYAFPTNVAAFHIFDVERSTGFRPIMKFAPQQSLPVALTQFAPGKQLWISGKCYTSGAIYSVNQSERQDAWKTRRIYMECGECGFANTYSTSKVERNLKQDCEACGSINSFGPSMYWLSPPGFAHPINEEVGISSDDYTETSYASRAKLTINSPDKKDKWKIINSRIRVLTFRKQLLVSNTGPGNEGYTYCTSCGRIEASANKSKTLFRPHQIPYPQNDNKQICENPMTTKNLVLGTEFITDIALFSLSVETPISLKPGLTSTNIALRTISEALSNAACRLLEIDQGEIIAEFRPALSKNGIEGLETEIFLYDSLSGGAGFSSQLAFQGNELFQLALNLMENCPEECESSCYRCLRSFKNKFEHALLDRHVGIALIKYLLGETNPFNNEKLPQATEILFHDLKRQSDSGINFSLNAKLSINGEVMNAPILAETNNGKKIIISLTGPLTPNLLPDPKLNRLDSIANSIKLIPTNELLVRKNLPFTSSKIIKEIHDLN